MQSKKLPAHTAFILLGCAILAGAGIYKYQDAEGEWHFTDHPPKGQETETVAPHISPPASADAESIQGAKDLDKLLAEKLNPSNAIQRAALSVVGVRTSMGEGSGFFVSAQGHIVTNKRVVRPTLTTGWTHQSGELESEQEAVKAARKALEERRSALRETERIVESLKKAIRKGDTDRLRALAEETFQGAIIATSGTRLKKLVEDRYNAYKKNYETRMQEFLRDEKALREREQKIRRERTDRNIAGSLSRLAHTFEVRLKDGSRHSAELVAESANYDLALLKLDGFRTPVLPVWQGRSTQGMKVFALGGAGPIGGAMTSGIVTAEKENRIFTDARILGGSIGGPLIQSDGKVIGVTVAAGEDSSSIRGLGIAIPIGTVIREFRGSIGRR